MLSKAGNNLTPSDQKVASVAGVCEQGAECQRMKWEEGRGHHGGRGKKLDFILRARRHLKLKPHFMTHTPESVSEIEPTARKSAISLPEPPPALTGITAVASLPFRSSFLMQILLKVE